MFRAFPGGRSGLGLLLLRVALGASVLIQGGMDFAQRPDPNAVAWIVEALLGAAGAALLIGYLTPIAAGLAGTLEAAFWISIAPPPFANPFASSSSAALLGVIAAAVVLLGPGAYSLDARFFGLREIIIPSSRESLD